MEAIRIAARRVLEEKGLDGLTTNYVAEVAGVSIGSVYQYFPSKEAIVATVVEHRATETREKLRQLAQSLKRTDLEGAVGEVVRWYVDRYREDRAFYRAVLPEIETVRRGDYVRDRTLQIGSMIALGLGGFGDMIRVSDVQLAGFLIASALEGAMARAVMAGDEWLDRPELPDELTTMVIGYVTTPRQGAEDE